MENFEEHILFYYFKKGKKATEAREKLRRVYGRNVARKNASARTGSLDSMMIFQLKTLIAPIGLPRLTTMK